MPKFLKTFIRKQRKYILIFSIVSLFIAVVLTYRSYVYANFFDVIVDKLDTGNWRGFISALWLIIFVEMGLFGFRLWSVTIMTRYRGYMNIFVRLFGLDHIVEMNYTNLAKLGSGKLLQIVHSGMEGYSFFIYKGLLTGINIVVSMVAIIMVLVWQNPWFLIYFILSFFLIYFGTKIAFKYLKNARLRDRDLNESYTKQTTKILMNFVLLKVFGIKQQELDHLYHIGMKRVNNFVWIRFWFNGVASVANFLLIVLLMICVRYFGRLYLVGEVSADIFFFVFLLIAFSRSHFYQFGLFIAELAEKMTYIHRFDEILTQAQHEQSLDDGINKDSLLSDIECKDIRYSYDENIDPLFDGLSVDIPAGQKLAIVGRSGSGKSTFFKMLTRLVNPQYGEITIGDTGLSDISYNSVFKNIGYFYQDPLVFDGTVRQNLCLNTDMDEGLLQQALDKVALDGLNLDTIIGERGLLLSGGEKQRLAMARAFLFDFDILLLDEPTSNLDLELEKKVLRELFNAYSDKTIIVISHRPFVLDYVDRVLVMSKGSIRADGTFDQVRDQIDGLDT